MTSSYWELSQGPTAHHEPPNHMGLELEQLLPRAEALNKTGCNTREAWGRASAEFPELKAGRSLVELFLVWKTSTESGDSGHTAR